MEDNLIKLIQQNLSDDLLKNKFKGNKNALYGHCYVAIETYYHLLDDDEKKDYTPSTLKIGDVTHWFLKHKKNDKIIDITSQQFDFKLDYNKSINKGFLTKHPSKRAKILINRIYESL